MQTFKKHWLFLCITFVFILLLQYVPYLYHSSLTPPGHVYLGAERYAPDYYIYLYLINQGKSGHLLISNLFTNIPHPSSIVHIEYAVIGIIGNVINLSAQISFYLSRSLFLIIYLLISYWFIGLFFKNTSLHRLTFLLSIFWGGILGYFDFYQPPDLLNRLTFEPNKLIGMSIFLVLLVLISKSIKHNSIRIIIFSILLILLAGLIHALSLIMLIATLGVYFLLYFFLFLLSKPTLLTCKSLVKKHWFAIVAVILSVLPLLYWQIVFTHNPVWNYVASWEHYYSQIDRQAGLNSTIIGILLILGPLFALSLVGLRRFIKEHQNLGLLLFSFLLSQQAIFWLGYIFLGISKQRVYQTPYLVILSILAMYGIIQLNSKCVGRLDNFFSFAFASEKESNKTKTLISREYSGTKKIEQATKTCNIIIVSILLLLGLPNFKQGLDKELYQFGQKPNVNYVAFPSLSLYNGLIWLKNNTTNNAVILSLPDTGQLIPGVSGRYIVTGNPVLSYDYFHKTELAQNFFRGTQTDIEAQNYLKSENVNYIFTGPDEKALGDISGYPFLKPVYKNNEITIFKIFQAKP